MKRFILWALLMFSPLFLSPVYAFNPSNDDDDDEEEIIVLVSTTEEGQNGNRGFAFIPMEVSYSHTNHMLIVHFLYDLGYVNCNLSNLHTGNTISYQVNSCLGTDYLPVVCGSGFYSLTINTPDGASYFGHFAY